MEEAKKTVDLNGSYSFKTDAKGRVSLPAKFRKVLSDDLVVTSALSGDYLMVFDGQESFNAWVDGIFAGRFEGGYNPAIQQHQKLRSALKGNAFDVQLDGAGRILLPANLREKAAIDREVVIVGNTGFFEVWSEERRRNIGISRYCSPSASNNSHSNRTKRSWTQRSAAQDIPSKLPGNLHPRACSSESTRTTPHMRQPPNA